MSRFYPDFAEDDKNPEWHLIPPSKDYKNPEWHLIPPFLANNPKLVQALKTAITKASDALIILQKTCFAPGTPILTPEGAKPIELFRENDLILSRPEHDPAAPVRVRNVEAVFVLAAPIVELYVGGHVIETTAEHPFFVHHRGWVPARDLQVGDLLLGHDEKLTPVERLTQTGRTATVYNLRVNEDHTFFVGDRTWGFSVWVHNAYLVRQAADGTFEVIDGAGKVVLTGLLQDEAESLANGFNAAAWKQVGRRSGDPLELQSAFSGKPITYRNGKAYIEEYELGGVSFDRIKDGILGEAKGNYDFASRVSPYVPKLKAVKQLQDEAARQIAIAAEYGIQLEWHVRAQDLAFFKNVLVALANSINLIPY